MQLIPGDLVDNTLSDEHILRRYLDLPKFIDLLRTNSLYLGRADLFQDKFEGSFTPSIRAAIEEAYANAQDTSYNYEKLKREIREGVYVSCWSLGEDDNMALWEIYGKSEFSVAITTTVGRLRSEIAAWNNFLNTTLRKVQYVNHWNNPALNIIPFSNIFRYKIVAYFFENEVRIIHDMLQDNSEKIDKKTAMYMNVNLDQLITNIIVSPLAKSWFFDLVADLVIKYNINVPVKMSKLAIDPI